MVAESDLRLKWPQEREELMRFTKEIWRNKPWSHNRQPGFYDYLLRQPNLASGEVPVIRSRNDSGIVGTYCMFKHYYKKWTISSGANYYVLDAAAGDTRGAQLLLERMRSADILFSSTPRRGWGEQLKRAGWLELPTVRLKYQRSWVNPLNRFRSRYRSSRQAGCSVLRTKRLAQCGDEVDRFFVGLRRHYRFFERDSRILNWRYLGTSAFGAASEMHAVYGGDEEIAGLFALVRHRHYSRGQVSEVWALPGQWGQVVNALASVVEMSRGMREVRMRTNYAPLIEEAEQRGFIKGESELNYFKAVKPSAFAVLDEFRQHNFILSASDGDDYLL